MDDGGAVTAISTLARCGGCGYWLKDLPPAGNCPECGQAYDDKRIVLLGWARGSHASAQASRGMVAAAFMLLLLVQLGPHGLFRALDGLFAGNVRGLLLCASYVMVIATMLLSRWDRSIRETTRVVLSDEGFLQEAVPHASPMSVLVYIALICCGMANIAAEERPIGKRDIIIVVSILGVIAVIEGVRYFVRRGKGHPEAARPVPWAQAADAQLSGEGEGRYQIRIDKSGRWACEDVVNMDLDLTIPQRDELERRLSAWVPKEPRKLGLG